MTTTNINTSIADEIAGNRRSTLQRQINARQRGAADASERRRQRLSAIGEAQGSPNMRGPQNRGGR